MIKSLELTHARCFGKKTIQFQQPKTYMYGDNGVGKTTILEAIHLIATTKSHRTNQDKEFILNPLREIVEDTRANTPGLSSTNTDNILSFIIFLNLHYLR